MRRLIPLFVVVLLILAACGGESTDGGVGDKDGDQTTATQPTDEGGSDDSGSDAQTPPATEADDDPVGEGPSTATVTIGDETYEFSSEGAAMAQCLPDMYGIMSVILPLADGGDGGIAIIALHEGTDPVEMEQINTVHVDIGDANWIADPEDVRWNGDPDTAALSQVDSVEIDGSTLTGTASFVARDNTTQEWVSITGTFEATCGEERER